MQCIPEGNVARGCLLWTLVDLSSIGSGEGVGGGLIGRSHCTSRRFGRGIRRSLGLTQVDTDQCAHYRYQKQAGDRYEGCAPVPEPERPPPLADGLSREPDDS